ncbi:MAG: hypothetical protein JNJ54_32085 [Myxococcaceae bacterium]|nr:hypothetical protein [Myxococcaceae bacterium]
MSDQRIKGPTVPRQAPVARTAPRAPDRPPTPPPAAAAPKGWTPKPRAARPVQAPPTKEQIVQEVLKDGPKGTVGQAVDYWKQVGQQGGAKGVAGKVMGGLLEFSGLPAVERSAAELGARVGVDDSKANIAKAGGKLAFNAGVVVLNGLAAGKAVTSVLGLGGKAANLSASVVRHYTSADTAQKIMQSGEIWASKVGNAGVDKVYLLAEQGSGGMNFLRRLNIGYGSAAKTAKAIEINLTKLPPEVAAKFVESAASGPLALEKFVTHAGSLNFNAFRDAVRVLDTNTMRVTMEQLGKAGASLGKVVAATVSGNRAAGSVNEP